MLEVHNSKLAERVWLRGISQESGSGSVALHRGFLADPRDAGSFAILGAEQQNEIKTLVAVSLDCAPGLHLWIAVDSIYQLSPGDPDCAVWNLTEDSLPQLLFDSRGPLRRRSKPSDGEENDYFDADTVLAAIRIAKTAGLRAAFSLLTDKQEGCPTRALGQFLFEHGAQIDEVEVGRLLESGMALEPPISPEDHQCILEAYMSHLALAGKEFIMSLRELLLGNFGFKLPFFTSQLGAAAPLPAEAQGPCASCGSPGPGAAASQCSSAGPSTTPSYEGPRDVLAAFLRRYMECNPGTFPNLPFALRCAEGLIVLNEAVHEHRQRADHAQWMEQMLAAAPQDMLPHAATALRAQLSRFFDDVTMCSLNGLLGSVDIRSALLDMVDQAIICTDLKARIVFWNPFATKLYGWSARETLGRPITEVLAHEMDKTMAEELMASLVAGNSWKGEFPLVRRDGSQFWALVTNSPIHDSRGTLIGIVGMSIDYSEYRQQRLELEALSKELEQRVAKRTEELQTANALLMQEVTQRRHVEKELRLVSSVAKKTDTSVIITDAAHRHTVWVNDACQRLTGYTLEEMVGRTPGAVLQCKESDREVIEAMRKAFAGGMPHCGDIVNKRKDGTLYTVSMDMFPIHDDHGNVCNWVSMERLIDKGEETAKALEAAANAKATAIASKLKSDFIMTMSHECRTPVNGIMGMASCALEGDLSDPAEVREDLQTIYNASRILATMLNNMLDLPRIEQGVLDCKHAIVGLEQLVRGSVAAVESLGADRRVTVEVSIAPSLPRLVSCDKVKLRQVLHNLLQNALKFARPDTAITVTVEDGTPLVAQGLIPMYRTPLSCRQMCSRSGSLFLLVRVRDCGPGIPREKIEGLFCAFSQLHTTGVEPRLSGTGLGLHICRQLLYIMGGTVWLSWSQEGEGSEFSFVVEMMPGPPCVDPTCMGERGQCTHLTDVTATSSEDEGAPALADAMLYLPLRKRKRASTSSGQAGTVSSAQAGPSESSGLGGRSSRGLQSSQVKEVSGYVTRWGVSRGSPEGGPAVAGGSGSDARPPSRRRNRSVSQPELRSPTARAGNLPGEEEVNSAVSLPREAPKQSWPPLLVGGSSSVMDMALDTVTVASSNHPVAVQAGTKAEEMGSSTWTGGNAMDVVGGATSRSSAGGATEHLQGGDAVGADGSFRASSGAVQFPLLNVSVLLVEDSVVNQKVFKRMVTKYGLQPEVVGDGQAAIDVCKAKHFDVIFMDKTGLEATHEIREALGVHGGPVVAAWTAYASESDKLKCFAVGCDAHLQKPLQDPLLRSFLYDALPTLLLERREGRAGKHAGHVPGKLEGALASAAKPKR
eukprot:jgi/Mesvir1/7690/Mv11656-RA.5